MKTILHGVTLLLIFAFSAQAQQWSYTGTNTYYLGNNVGIGTGAPLSTLDVRKTDGVNGATAIVANFIFGGQNHFGSGEGRIIFGTQAFSNGIQKRAGLGFVVSGWNGGGALNFYTTPNNDTYTPLNRMTIDNIGNVGIGTATPGAKLSVDGNVTCEEISVEVVQGTAPDYVFEENYNLLALKEIEAYINQNHHLPEVPSAKEMEANGLNLREMSLLLLKKVEELTLHVIELKKENESIKKQISNK